MKIAITGHTHGIGKAFAEQLAERGHYIVGISRRDGENIRRVQHTASLIEPCDLFINNAQSQYAQTELFYEVWKRWSGQEKYIWNISTMMTEEPVNSMPDGQDDIVMSQYRNQKLALEEASKQLRYKNCWPQISIIKPGGVATQEQNDNTNKADVKLWVNSVIDTFAHNNNIFISEISIGYTKKRIPI
jgi:NAD(P)-dependent dehydrogenase (short-subunit alcohol dehydrogenase family)